MFPVWRWVGLGVLTVVLVGCGGAPSASKPPPGAGSAPVAGSASTKASPLPASTGELVQIGPVAYANWGNRDARGDKSRDLDAGDFYYKGTFIQGDPGQALTLAIQNVADQVHNISIPAQGVDQDIPPNSGRVSVAVTFPPSGGLQFFCKFHTARGMNGLLLAGDATPQSIASPEPVASPQRPG